MDVHSDVDRALAQRLAYALDHAAARPRGEDAKPLGGAAKPVAHDAERLRQAADLLRNWDGNMEADSPAAAIVAAVREELWPALLIPQILAWNHANGSGPARNMTPQQAATVALLYTWGERSTALELLVGTSRHAGSPTPTDAGATSSRPSPRVPSATRTPPPTSASGAMATATPSKSPIPSSATSACSASGSASRARPASCPPRRRHHHPPDGAHFGPSERFTADLSSPATAFANLTTGESGDGLSAWYLDQFRPWMYGTTFALPLTGDAAIHTLRLVPR